MVKADLFNTISEVARDAIRRQMEAHTLKRLASIKFDLAKGEESIEAGRVVSCSSGPMLAISEKGEKAARKGKLVRHEAQT